MSVADRVRRIVEPVLVEQGLECFDIDFSGGRLVVLADRPGGIDLDALTEATRAISFALDQEDPVPGRYVLEVSSPGLERRLRTPAHFARFVGTTLSIKLVPTAAEPRRLKACLDAVDSTGITVGDRTIAFADIDRAQTVFEWGPSPRPGKPQPGKPQPGRRQPARAQPGKPQPATAQPGEPSRSPDGPPRPAAPAPATDPHQKAAAP